MSDGTGPGRPPPLRRRPLRATLSGLLVVGFGLLGALIYTSAGHKVAVLAVARPIQLGQAIQPGDLVTTHITRSVSLRPVPATSEGSVVGRRAGVAMVPGQLLTMAALATGPAMAANQTEVGVSLQAGDLPDGALVAGDPVEVVLTGSSGGGRGMLTETAGTVLASGTVAASPEVSTSSGNTELSLLVPLRVGPVVAAASAAGRVAVVLLPSGGAP